MKIGKFSSLQLWSPASSTVTTGGMWCLPYLGEVWLILAGLCLHHWTFPAFVLSQLKLIVSQFYTFSPTFLYQADNGTMQCFKKVVVTKVPGQLKKTRVDKEHSGLKHIFLLLLFNEYAPRLIPSISHIVRM